MFEKNTAALRRMSGRDYLKVEDQTGELHNSIESEYMSRAIV